MAELGQQRDAADLDLPGLLERSALGQVARVIRIDQLPWHVADEVLRAADNDRIAGLQI
jgi:hypothetical protein